MTMAGREGRMLNAIYRTYGQNALWTPADGSGASNLVVRHVVEDITEAFGRSAAVIRSNLIFVRRAAWEPIEGDRVEVFREDGGSETFLICAEPRLEPSGLEWLCEAKVSAS